MSDLDDFDAIDADQGAGDPKKVKKNKKVDRDEENQRQEFWRQVLATTAGRAIIWELLEKCHVFSKIFAGEQTHHMANREGKREVGIDIFEIMFQSAPESYNLMRREALDREERKKERVNG